MASTSTGEIRRTARPKKPSLKAMESLYASKLKQSGFVASVSSDDDISFEDFDELEDVEKPKLIHENEMVHGEKIFAFQSRKQKEGMANKAAEIQKTPYIVRSKIKSKLKSRVEDYEDSGSEYECSSTSESGSSEEDSGESCESASEESDTEVTKKSTKPVQRRNKIIEANLQTAKHVKGASKKYTIKTDEYFSNFSSKKIKTSNNTLDNLQTPRLPQYQLQKLLSDIKLSRTHQKAINNLAETNKENFKKWLYLLNENFNILLYGLGSKRDIIKNFHMEYLKDLPVIVINGFFPSLTIKNILDEIIWELLEITNAPSNINEACDLIINEFEEMPENHLYLLIHNIDGEMLRNSKSQSILARLASTKNIHLIASIDHINAPLIWDHNKLSKFNYIWWDVTQFLPYSEETSFEKSMMVQQSGSLALSSLRNVFLSLTTNSKAIYLKLVKHQLENTSQYYQGMAFKDLYMVCRESFIVSSDLALRAQLSEFIDHKMVKSRRSAEDGTEYLVVPIANTLLQKFLDENS